jgi:hypothetical protein
VNVICTSVQLRHVGLVLRRREGHMTTVNSGRLAFDGLRTGGFVRPAAEKFAGAWLACLIVMARGNIFAAFSFDHLLRATVCGTVGALVTVVLLVQMDRSHNSVGRQATVSAVATLIGDIFAHPSHFGPQWAEPVVTAAVSAGIAVAWWFIKRRMRFAKT